MFTIIGGDNKPYGPSTVESARLLRQGRADGRTLARKDEGEWKPLAAFPEFADLLGASGSPPPLPHSLGKGSLPAPSPDEITARDFSLDVRELPQTCLGAAPAKLLAGGQGLPFSCLRPISWSTKPSACFRNPPWKTWSINANLQYWASLFFLTSTISTPYRPCLSGIFPISRRLMRGEEAGLSDAFSGFGIAFGPLFLVGLVGSVLQIFAVALYCLLWAALRLASFRIVDHHWVLCCVLFRVFICLYAGLAYHW